MRPADPPASAFRRVVGNTVWFALSETGGRLLSFAAILFLTRTLTLADIGMVEFGLAVFTFTSLVSTGAVGILAMPRAARTRHGLARLAGTTIVIGWCQFLVVLAAFVAGAWLFRWDPAMKRGMLLFGLAAGVVPLGLRSVLTARELAPIVAVATLAGQATFLGLCLLLVRASDDAGRVPFLLLAGTSVQSAVQLAGFMRAYGPLHFRLRTAHLAAWLRATAALAPGVAARNLMLGIDVLLLGALVESAEVARYGIALKIPLFLATLAFLGHGAVFPSVARATGDRARLAAISRDIVGMAVGVALPGVLCLAAVAEPLMVILFTDKFRASAPLFTVLLWRFPLAAVGGLFRNLVWIERPAADARIAIQALAVAVPAIVLLVARLGTVGAALGILSGELVALALYVRAARVPLAVLGLGDRRGLARLVVGLGLAAAVVWRVRTAAPPAAIAAALIAWGSASLVANLPFVHRFWREVREHR